MPHWIHILLVIAVILCLGRASNIRERFHERFVKKCSKYSFVQEYIQILENPYHKYLFFIYHDTNLANGGFGDRMGGMMSAFIQALRFNRTLIIQSKNGFNELFRPYHPLDISKPFNESVYTWKNALKWSKFQDWKRNNTGYARNKRDYEYDLSSCVSNTEQGFAPAKVTECAMDLEEDIRKIDQFPILKFASNRAYLCRWLSNKKDLSFVHQEILQTLPIALLKEKGKVNLFEIAGCMFRLMMWPTDLLWEKVDQSYEEMLSPLWSQQPQPTLSTSTPTLTHKINTTKDSGEDGAKELESNENEHENKKKSSKKKSKKTNKNKKKSNKTKSKKTKSKKFADSTIDDETPANTVSLPVNTAFPALVPSQFQPSYTLSPHPIYQIGLHLRCGDMWSYKNLLLANPGYDEYACVHDPNDVGKHEKSKYLVAGNPHGIGSCMHTMLQSYQTFHAHSLKTKVTKKPAQRRNGPVIEVDSMGNMLSVDRQEDHSEPINAEPYELTEWIYHKNMTMIVYVTSDNIKAEEQMIRMVDYPQGTIHSPQGCHIEYDPSKDCYHFTTVYWFALSLSSLYVTQTFSDWNMPTSSFSRYAGIYSLSLYDSPFRSGRYCGDEVFSMTKISWKDQGNWVCKL